MQQVHSVHPNWWEWRDCGGMGPLGIHGSGWCRRSPCPSGGSKYFVTVYPWSIRKSFHCEFPSLFKETNSLYLTSLSLQLGTLKHRIQPIKDCYSLWYSSSLYGFLDFSINSTLTTHSLRTTKNFLPIKRDGATRTKVDKELRASLSEC